MSVVCTVCGHGDGGEAGLTGDVVLSLGGVGCKKPILVIQFRDVAIPLGIWLYCLGCPQTL